MVQNRGNKPPKNTNNKHRGRNNKHNIERKKAKTQRHVFKLSYNEGGLALVDINTKIFMRKGQNTFLDMTLHSL